MMHPSVRPLFTGIFGTYCNTTRIRTSDDRVVFRRARGNERIFAPAYDAIARLNWECARMSRQNAAH